MNSTANLKASERIRQLNDGFRTTYIGGRVMLTRGFIALAATTKARVLEAIKTFNAWDAGNDPYGEHDFMSVEVDGEKIFAKIDYYSPDMESASGDPADPNNTTRVLTIMCADEY
jgi:hypothetical protein